MSMVMSMGVNYIDYRSVDLKASQQVVELMSAYCD